MNNVLAYFLIFVASFAGCYLSGVFFMLELIEALDAFYMSQP